MLLDVRGESDVPAGAARCKAGAFFNPQDWQSQFKDLEGAHATVRSSFQVVHHLSRVHLGPVPESSSIGPCAA